MFLSVLPDSVVFSDDVDLARSHGLGPGPFKVCAFVYIYIYIYIYIYNLITFCGVVGIQVPNPDSGL